MGADQRRQIPILPRKAPRIQCVRIVDVPDGNPDDVRGSVLQHVRQGLRSGLGIQIDHLHLVTIFQRPGHIVQAQRVDRIGVFEPIGGYQQDSQCPASGTATDRPASICARIGSHAVATPGVSAGRPL